MRLKRSLSFYRWFNKSQVVTPNGDPLVVYHGTGSSFTRFGTGRGAIYFTSDPHVASLYAEHSDSYNEDGDVVTDTVEPSPNVIPAFLSIANPLIVDERWATKKLGPAGDDRDWVDFDSIIDDAYRKGRCDGVILRGVVDFFGMDGEGERIYKAYDQYIVFEPRQIKSAIGNSGRYEVDSCSLADHPDEDVDSETQRPAERMRA